MLHEEKKVAKIVEELTMFFFTIESTNMNSSILKLNNEAVITFHANYNPKYEKSIDKLEECFNEKKNHGMEDIFWQLAGSGDPGETSQLLLIGMMIDRFEIVRQENEVKLTLYKKWI